jgi:alpha-L-fucosidase
MPNKTTITLLAFIQFFYLTTPVLAQSQTNKRAQWFVDARFGMFIHWGVYSGAEGFWKGEKLRNNNDYAEWIYYRNSIEENEYLGLLDRFDWDNIDPEKWVLLAKESGMKYVTLTAKHHDGFALWDSKVSDFDIADHTEKNRDIVGELAEACQKHGLKLGLYYSHWVDWEHEYGWDHTKEIYPITGKQFDEYWQQKVIPQIDELLSNYGPIGLLWFDMWIHHSETIVSKAQLVQLKQLIRQLQPNCLINSRLGLSVDEDPDVDFRTLGDNQFGTKKLDYPWQSPATAAHSWGFHRGDTQWKSTSAILQNLIGNVSLNGNLMLNIGPRANGSIPLETSRRMLEIGSWLEVNGDAIYKAGAANLPTNLHDWGKITYGHGDDGLYRVFLHVYTNPLNGKLPVSGIATEPIQASLLSDKSRKPLDFSFNQVFTEVELPDIPAESLISVVVLEYDTEPMFQGDLIAKSMDDGFSLTHNNAMDARGTFVVEQPERRGTIPKHIGVRDTYQATWKVFFDLQGQYIIDASYSFQGLETDATILIEMAGKSSACNVKSTGLTVGEPNRKWHIERYKSHRLDTISISTPGIYEISMKIKSTNDHPVNFQWLWIEQ